MIKNILVSVSGSTQALVAAKYAIVLARLLQAKLSVVYVIDTKALAELLRSRIFVEVEARSYEEELQQQGTIMLERIKKMAEAKSVNTEVYLLRGAIHEEVIKKVEDLPADILVLGELKDIISRTETFYDEGERIFRTAPCPVLIVKNPAMVEQLYKEII
ncbi:MAG: universal stress protein [Candidatus Omnitrophica bacterium]|nr:universal stress protein [Candidatus Omnitrophota bacterium]